MLHRSLFGAVALAATIIAVGCTDSMSPVASAGFSPASGLFTARGAPVTVCQTVGAPSDPRYQELTVSWRGANGLTRQGINYVSSFFRACPPPPAGYAPLYLCNVTSDQSLLGTSINFLVNGTQSVTLSAGASQTSANCTNVGQFAVESSVTLQEQVPAGIELAYVAFSYNSPGGLTDYDPQTAQAVVTIGPVTNVFSFYNVAATP